MLFNVVVKLTHEKNPLSNHAAPASFEHHAYAIEGGREAREKILEKLEKESREMIKAIKDVLQETPPELVFRRAGVLTKAEKPIM